MLEEPLRVLQIITSLDRGGIETMLMNHYRAIDRNKIQFDFLVHTDSNGKYGQEVLELGGHIYHIQRLNPLSLKYKQSLKHFFLSHDYQIIHVHQDCLSAVIIKIAKECGIPVRIAHSHTANQEKNLKYILKLFYKKRIKKYATDLLACSKKAGKWMFETDNFQIFNNAINTNDFVFNSEIKRQIKKEFALNDEFIIGHVGNFSDTKNHLYMLDVFAEYLKICDNAKLIFVGDGGLRPAIEGKIAELHLEDKVILTGGRGDVNRIMQCFDVFIMPSKFEGLPVVLIEAQAAGLPCLISDRISSECKITDQVYMLSIDEPAKKWAKKLNELSRIKRVNNYEKIRAAGYDVQDNAIRLQKYYYEKMEKN